MILKSKHEQRMDRIKEVGKDQTDSALVLMSALKKLVGTSDTAFANIKIFEDQIRGKRNG